MRTEETTVYYPSNAEECKGLLDNVNAECCDCDDVDTVLCPYFLHHVTLNCLG